MSNSSFDIPLGLIIDFFAGGGGASTGIEMALGRSPDIAINHDPDAILMHKTNHPHTIHLTEDIFKVNLTKYVKGRHVALLWASPDCTSHSKAKGGQPRESGLRILPWAVFKHAKQILPDVIIMENVEEIQQWGPLDENGHPIEERKGEDYRKFIVAMTSLGYVFDSKELVAADYGAPTIRKRWYAIFRRDGKAIVWPKPTHSKNEENGLLPWEPIWKYLNLSDWGTSIFGRKKPLAKNTMNRIAKGLDKFVFHSMNPFIVQVNHSGDSFRGQNIQDPISTITAKHGFGLVTPVHASISEEPRYDSELAMQFITKFYRTCTGQSLFEPIHTITTSPGHFGNVTVYAMPKEKLFTDLQADHNEKSKVDEVLQKCTWVSQFIMEYYGSGIGQCLNDPLHTVVTKDRFALITICGNEYVIMDIFLRMLKAEPELKLGQGFPEDYIIDKDYTGKMYPGHKQVARIGNSVVPIMAQKLVEANCSYLKVGDRVPNLRIREEKTGQMKFA